MSSSDPATLHNVPAATPPPGVTQDPANPSSGGPVAIIVGSLLLALVALFLGVRIYTKVKIVKQFSPDDCEFAQLVGNDSDISRYMYSRSCKGLSMVILDRKLT